MLEMSETNEFTIDNSVVSAEVDLQIKTAKTYPRNIKRFLEEAKNIVSIDQETAESCIYCLPPRKSKDKKTGKLTEVEIKGGSARLAEIVAYAWKNLHCATRIVEQNARYITAQGVAWDLENNVKIMTEVKRSIVNSSGETYNDNMITMTANAASSIALRNSIFKVIPKSFVNIVYKQATQVAIGSAETMTSRRQKMFERFSKMGVTKEMILAYLKKPSEIDVDAEDMEKLIGIFNALKSNEATIEEFFVIEEVEPPKELTKTEKMAEKIAQDL